MTNCCCCCLFRLHGAPLLTLEEYPQPFVLVEAVNSRQATALSHPFLSLSLSLSLSDTGIDCAFLWPLFPHTPRPSTPCRPPPSAFDSPEHSLLSVLVQVYTYTQTHTHTHEDGSILNRELIPIHTHIQPVEKRGAFYRALKRACAGESRQQSK